jgi:hypothetical protein
MTKRINKIIIKQMYDTDPDLSYLQQDYTSKEVSAKENRMYQAQDKKRLEAYYNDEWHMTGVKAVAEIHIIKDNWTEVINVDSFGLWGIESDSGEEYIKEVAQEQIEDLSETLAELGFNKEEVTKAPVEYKEVYD